MQISSWDGLNIDLIQQTSFELEEAKKECGFIRTFR